MSPRAAVFLQFIGLMIIGLTFAVVRAWAWAIRRMARGQPLLPSPKIRTVPWGFGSVLLVALAFFAVQITAGSIWVSQTGGWWNGRRLSFTESMFLVSVANATLLVLVPLLLRLTSGARLEDLGLRRGGWGRDVRVGVVASLLIAPLVYALNLVASLVWSRSTHPLEEMIRVQFSGRTAYLAVLSAVLLAPAAEELIFRGVIQGWLTRLFTTPAGADPKPDDLSGLVESIDLGGLSAPAGRRPWLLPRMPRPLREASRRRASSGMMPVVLTSALFALLHAEQWPAPLAIFFLSLGLGTVYQRSGSLLTSFTIHALFNGFSTLLLFTALLAGDAVGKNLKPVSGYLRGHGSIASGSGAGPVSKNLDSIIIFLLPRAPGTDTVLWVLSSFKTSRPPGQVRVAPEVRDSHPSPRGRDFQDMRVNIPARDGR